jgi:hypothetical protein
MSRWLYLVLVITCLGSSVVNAAPSIAVEIDPQASPRVEYGAARVVHALKELGIDSSLRKRPGDGKRIIVAVTDPKEFGRKGLDFRLVPTDQLDSRRR